MTHYDITIKNWVMQLEKGWKKVKKTLSITRVEISHKDNIFEDSYIIDKWHEVQILYP